MIDDYPIEGQDAGYVPCDELPAVLDADEEGAIFGIATGYVAQDQAASSLPAPEREAIVGSGVGFVPRPCDCEPTQNLGTAFRRFTPRVYDDDFGITIAPTIEPTSGATIVYGLAADGRGREGTVQYTINGAETALRITIAIWLDLALTSNNATHPRCYTNIPFDWELRRAGWGASFTPTYDDLQLDAVGSALASGTFTPPVTICYPYPAFPNQQTIFPILTHEDDFTPDGNGKIQFQLRISDLNAAAALLYNFHNFGSGFWNPVDDDWLYSHSVFKTTITICALY